MIGSRPATCASCEKEINLLNFSVVTVRYVGSQEADSAHTVCNNSVCLLAFFQIKREGIKAMKNHDNFKPMDHCGQCNKKITEGVQAHTVSLTSWMKHNPNIQAGSSTLTTCDSLECQLALLNLLTEDLKKRLERNKTNAVGPLPRGAPGCAFNGN